MKYRTGIDMRFERCSGILGVFQNAVGAEGVDDEPNLIIVDIKTSGLLKYPARGMNPSSITHQTSLSLSMKSMHMLGMEGLTENGMAPKVSAAARRHNATSSFRGRWQRCHPASHRNARASMR